MKVNESGKAIICFVVLIVLIVLLRISNTIYGKEEVNYPAIFGLSDFSNWHQVEVELGPPTKKEVVGDDIKWYYSQFEILFFHSGIFRTIEITGSDYCLKSKECHVGCTAEVVIQTYPEAGHDANGNLLCKDGGWYIRFVLKDNIVETITITERDI